MKYACPKCKGTDLRVECTIVAELVQQPDGHHYPEIESLEGAHYDEESLTLCANCDCEYQSELVDFEVPEHAPTSG